MRLRKHAAWVRGCVPLLQRPARAPTHGRRHNRHHERPTVHRARQGAAAADDGSNAAGGGARASSRALCLTGQTTRTACHQHPRLHHHYHHRPRPAVLCAGRATAAAHRVAPQAPTRGVHSHRSQPYGHGGMQDIRVRNVPEDAAAAGSTLPSAGGSVRLLPRVWLRESGRATCHASLACLVKNSGDTN